MNKKDLGIVLFSVGIGNLVYLYYGFYVPRNQTKSTTVK